MELSVEYRDIRERCIKNKIEKNGSDQEMRLEDQIINIVKRFNYLCHLCEKMGELWSVYEYVEK